MVSDIGMTEDRETILNMEQVVKLFPVDKKRRLLAVDEVSLKIHRGECVGVVGESGCGKSTLAKMAAGMEPVTSGRITFLGQDITGLKKAKWKEVRQQMQMVFQNPSGAFSPRMRVGEFLREPFRNGMVWGREKWSRQESYEECVGLLERVELDGSYMEKFPHQLSGGEQQRVVIARALAVRPSLLICDEATSALDVSIQAQIIGLLKRIQEEEQIGIFFICHDLALTQQFAGKIVVMYLGTVMEEIEGERLTEALHPYTRALLDCVFSVDGHRNRELKVLEGEIPDPVDRLKGCPFAGRCPKAGKRCYEEKPELKEVAKGHRVRCVQTGGLS